MVDNNDYLHNPTTGSYSENSSYFNPNEASAEKQRKFKRLWYYNENLRKYNSNDTDDSEQWRRDRLSTVDTISSNLELPQFQRQEARNTVKDLDFREYIKGGYLSLELYSFVICAMIHNNYVNSLSQKFLPTSNNNPELFEQIVKDYDFSTVNISQGFSEIREVYDQ